MIANCPGCGTHYKHEPPPLPVRARCGRCDTTLDLTRFRPYRITREAAPTREEALRAAAYMPIGRDHPTLATTIARNVGAQPPQAPAPASAPEPAVQAETPFLVESLAINDEASEAVGGEPRFEAVDEASAAPARDDGAGFALWTALSAIAGTGVSWMLGGATVDGLAFGAAFGAVTWWGLQRWISRNS
jgi:hypothetical protein